jgi:murein L,D-transpeptidase YcbB/YkuD
VSLFQDARLSIHRDALHAFTTLQAILALNGYVARRTTTGAYNCRKIAGTSSWSLHSLGIAADINWDTNPVTSNSRPMVTDLPGHVVSQIKQVSTVRGLQVFRWGGDFNRYKDPMHFELRTTRAETIMGIDQSTVPVRLGIVAVGCTGPRVAEVHRLLALTGFQAKNDNLYSTETAKAVTDWQEKLNLPADGVWGPLTQATTDGLFRYLRRISQ